MTKKDLLVLVLTAIVAGGIFAQEKTADAKKFWFSGETSFLGAGARGEYMLMPKLSAGLNAYWTSWFFLFNNIGINVVGRFYPWGKTFYAGLGFGLGVHSGIEPISKDGQTVPGTAWFIARIGFDVVPELGWKIDVGNPGGFFLNPLVQLPLTFGNQKWANTGEDHEGDFGFSVGFRASLGLGWAF
jgi:hypothetical protein